MGSVGMKKAGADFARRFAALLLAGIAFSAAGLAIQRGREVHAGAYRNVAFGYFITLPGGLEATTDAPPALPRHIDIALDDAGPSTMWIEASDGGGSLDEIQKQTLQEIRSKTMDFTVLAVGSGKIADMDAVRILVRYADSAGNGSIWEQRVVALRSDGKAVYTIGMIASVEKYDFSTSIFERILRSWRSIPIAR